jgi:hypothetical protein
LAGLERFAGGRFVSSEGAIRQPYFHKIAAIYDACDLLVIAGLPRHFPGGAVYHPQPGAVPENHMLRCGQAVGLLRQERQSPHQLGVGIKAKSE